MLTVLIFSVIDRACTQSLMHALQSILINHIRMATFFLRQAHLSTCQPCQPSFRPVRLANFWGALVPYGGRAREGPALGGGRAPEAGPLNRSLPRPRSSRDVELRLVCWVGSRYCIWFFLRYFIVLVCRGVEM